MANVCVDDTDFTVGTDGRLRIQTHAIKFANDVSTRVIPSDELAHPDIEQYDWIIPAYDRQVHSFGDALEGDPGSGRIIVKKAGLYHVSVAQGDNAFETNRGAFLYLTVLVNGGRRIRDGVERNLANVHWMACEDDLGLAAGDIVQVEYSVRFCTHNGPLADPCERGEHWLLPDPGNHFSMHRIGALL